MSSQDRDRGCIFPVRERDADCPGDSKGTRDPRDELDLDPFPPEHLEFLAAPAKEEGIASFEPDDSLSLSCFPDHQLLDLLLLERMVRSVFPAVDLFSMLRQ